MTHPIEWDKVTQEDVVRALKEYDRLGPEQFFAAHGYAPGRQTGPLTAADHASSPGYAPPDQFDPSQQGYWQ